MSVTLGVLFAATTATVSAQAATPTWAAFNLQGLRGSPTCLPPAGCPTVPVASHDMNASGWVAGYATRAVNGVVHWFPFVWRGGTNHIVRTPNGGVTLPGAPNAIFTAINDRGDAAGWTHGPFGTPPVLGEQPILYRNGVYTNLGSLTKPASSAQVFELNNSDTAVGRATASNGDLHAFMWRPGHHMIDINPPGSSRSYGLDVNAANQVLINAVPSSGVQRVYIYSDGSTRMLGSLGSGYCEGESINRSGTAVGSCAGSAVEWKGSKVIDLNQLFGPGAQSQALSINNNGDIVGLAWTATGGGQPYRWLYTGTQLINLANWTVTNGDQAAGTVNDNLQIASSALDNGSSYATVLEPATVYNEANSSLHYTGSWVAAKAADAWKGGLKTSTQAGASVSLTFTGKRVWWITSEGPAYGQAKVYVDGALQTTVDLGGAKGVRQTAYLKSFVHAGKHTLKISVVGTAGRPRVGVDAIAVSQR